MWISFPSREDRVLGRAVFPGPKGRGADTALHHRVLKAIAFPVQDLSKTSRWIATGHYVFLLGRFVCHSEASLADELFTGLSAYSSRAASTTARSTSGRTCSIGRRSLRAVTLKLRREAQPKSLVDSARCVPQQFARDTRSRRHAARRRRKQALHRLGVVETDVRTKIQAVSSRRCEPIQGCVQPLAALEELCSVEQ